jgi:hypothetical protein
MFADALPYKARFYGLFWGVDRGAVRRAEPPRKAVWQGRELRGERDQTELDRRDGYHVTGLGGNSEIR